MKTLDFLTLKQLGNEYILIPGEGADVNFNKMISLNPSAAYLWQGVEGKDFELQTLVDLLLEKYNVDAQTAERDSKVLLDKWLEAGIVIR